MVAEKLKVPLVDVYGIATFYNSFNLKPVGKHLITICMGTACHVRGGLRIVDSISRHLKIKPGETTPDFQFTLQTVNCLGCCAIGPVVVVDGEYHGHATIRKIGPILGKYGRPEAS
jgi:NADH-quinone oxidoreductase subunit E